MGTDAEGSRRFVEETLARAEEQARRSGRNEAEIAAAHREVEQYLAEHPEVMPSLAKAADAPRSVDGLPSLGPGWLMWALRHPLGWRVGVVVLVGLGGYFGLDGSRTGPQPFPDGPPGFLIGAAIGLVVLLGVEALSRFPRRRR